MWMCILYRMSPSYQYLELGQVLIAQIGSLIIVLHAPSDKEVETVDEILEYAAQPLFLAYLLFVTVFSLYMVYKVVPTHGTRNPMVYLSVCSLVGSVSVMAIKVSFRGSAKPDLYLIHWDTENGDLADGQGFGVALKLTFAGNNQLTHISTYVFGVVVVGCILVQMVSFPLLSTILLALHNQNRKGNAEEHS